METSAVSSAVSSVAALASSSANVRANDGVDISVLKMALDAQVQGAAALIQSIAESPQPVMSSNPNLGSHVDDFA